MILRRSNERGFADHGWLRSRHSFSFAGYHDPQHMGFGSLRVINEDRVEPGRGFGAHSHRDMEIISYVLAGELAHRDSLGNSSVILPGDVQRMSAGTGITHSEFNPSRDSPVHFLQIWIIPDRAGLPPGYEQKAFTAADKRGRLRLVASPDGSEGSVILHQDARLYAGLLDGQETAHHSLAPGRRAWVQVAQGEVAVNGETLAAGDAAAIDGGSLDFAGGKEAEILVFDLA